MPEVTGVLETCLYADDLERTERFYENVLGLKSLQRPDFSFKGMWYGVGSGQIHLIVSKKHDGPDPTGPHIAIEASWTEIGPIARQLLDRAFAGKAVLHLT